MLHWLHHSKHTCVPVRSGPCTQACQSNSIAPSYFATSQRYLKSMWSRCGHWQPTKLLAATCHSIGGSLHPTSSHGSNGNGTSWALCCPQSSGDLGRNPLVRIPSKPGDRFVDPLVQLPKSSGDLLPTWQLCFPWIQRAALQQARRPADGCRPTWLHRRSRLCVCSWMFSCSCFLLRFAFCCCFQDFLAQVSYIASSSVKMLPVGSWMFICRCLVCELPFVVAFKNLSHKWIGFIIVIACMFFCDFDRAEARFVLVFSFHPYITLWFYMQSMHNPCRSSNGSIFVCLQCSHNTKQSQGQILLPLRADAATTSMRGRFVAHCNDAVFRNKFLNRLGRIWICQCIHALKQC